MILVGPFPPTIFHEFYDPHREKGEDNVISPKSQFPKIVREDFPSLEGHIQPHLQTLLFM